MAMELSAQTKTIPKELIETAIRKGDVTLVKDFLKTTTDPNLTIDGWTENTTLHLAALCNQLEIVKTLLTDERVNPDAVNNVGHTALDCAVTQASFEVVSLLSDRTFNKDIELLLLNAIRALRPEIVKYFLQAGVAVNPFGPLNKESVLPLFAAIWPNNDVKMVEMLIKAGANVNRLDNKHHSPLSFAISFGSVLSLDLISLLINEGADVNFRLRNGRSVLMMAIENQREDVALKLVDCNADADIVSGHFTALHLAVRFGYLELVKRLVPMTSIHVLQALCTEEEDDSSLFCCAISCLRQDILSVLLNHTFTEPIMEEPKRLMSTYRTVVYVFRSQFDHDFAYRLYQYEFIGPLCLLLIEGIYEFGGAAITFLNQMIGKGFSVEPRKENYLPPLLGLLLGPHMCLSNETEAFLPFRKSALEILLSANVNVDYMIDNMPIPEALRVAARMQDWDAFSLMLPYSRFSPCAIAEIGIEHKMEYLTVFILTKMIENDDYSCLWKRRDDAFVKTVCAPFTFVVPSLQVIARQRVRQCLPDTKTSAEFVKVVNTLEIPLKLRAYLRYSL